MYGIIDIGSNTMRLSCYRVVEKTLLPTFHKKYMAGLAGYVTEEHFLSEEGIQVIINALKDFRNIVMCVGLDKCYVIATASLRNVENTEDILKTISEETGFEVVVLSGKQEALYDFKGATYNTTQDSGMVVDIGGGSTELVCFNDQKAEHAISIPLGSLSMFSKHVNDLFPAVEEQAHIRSHVHEELEKLNIKEQKHVLGVGGTIRACMKLYNDYYKLDSTNTEMECAKINQMLLDMLDNPKKAMKKILKIVPDRIHTILPGLLVLDEINSYYKCNQVQLSAWGVREGYMIEKVL